MISLITRAGYDARHTLVNEQCQVIEAPFRSGIGWRGWGQPTTRGVHPLSELLNIMRYIPWRWFIARYAFFDTCLEATGFQKDPSEAASKKREREREVDELRTLDGRRIPTAVPFILNSIHAIEFYISFPPSDERLRTDYDFTILVLLFTTSVFTTRCVYLRTMKVWEEFWPFDRFQLCVHFYVINIESILEIFVNFFFFFFSFSSILSREMYVCRSIWWESRRGEIKRSTHFLVAVYLRVFFADPILY